MDFNIKLLIMGGHISAKNVNTVFNNFPEYVFKNTLLQFSSKKVFYPIVRVGSHKA
jgi:hypothetical protein